ncbi:MAG: peptidase U32 family protein [Bacteroidales bacterium]|nr:peptidase U32 family protein [Bacteroidales bacterium]
MNITRKDIEIMAPVGSRESLMAAIQGKADSVYFGVEQLNMRARSSHNFTEKDLPEIIEICRVNNIKSYLTLNVVIYDEEVEQLKSIIRTAADSGISAIIASDLAAIQNAYEAGVEVHLSTQVNISNFHALKFYSQWADTVVLARELNLLQVRKIYEQILEDNTRGPSGRQVRIEMFAHGALCMAISGKCYLSLHENNKSANRGNCYQTCRKGYLVRERETGYELDIDNEYIMSPKDLCTIGFVNKLLDAGVRVLKIEGRARSPEYVKTVAEAYNEAVGALINGTYDGALIEKLRNKLASVFNRGFWDGYYLGRKMGEWSHNYGSSATRRKIYLGRVNNYFTRLKVAEIKLETGDMQKGDELLIIGPGTGVINYTVSEIRVDDKATDKSLKGETCSIPVDTFLRRSDKIYKWVYASDIRRQ